MENDYNKDGDAANNVKDLRKKDAKALFFIKQAMDDAIFSQIAAEQR